MGRACSLSENEKRTILRLASKSMSISEIARKTKRSRNAIAKVLKDPYAKRVRNDKGKLRKISRSDMTKIKRACFNNPLSTSKKIFIEAGVDTAGKNTRNKLLNIIARSTKPSKQPVITDKHKEKRLKWAQEYMKLDFNTVIFTDECRATLDGPDGWSRGWLRQGVPLPLRMRRQQGGGGVMIWAGILGSTLIGAFRVPDGVKINSESYIAFLREHFMPWYKKRPVSFKRKAIFMQDGAPAHTAKATKEFLASMGFKNDRLMEWAPISPDINCIENLWSIMKRKIYEDGRQFKSKNDLWNTIQDVSKSITPQEIANLTQSMDKRLYSVILRGGKHIRY